jgi:phage baseplate assembly protein gpV
MSTSERDDEQRKYVPGTLGEQVVLAIDVNHAVLENALPLVTDTRHLSTISAPTKSHKVSTNLIIGAKDEVLRHSTLVVIAIVLVRVVQIAIDSLRVRDGRSGSRLR